MPDTLGSTELKKGEVYTITVWTGESEYDYLGGFSPGDYIAAAHVSFSLDYDLEKDVLGGSRSAAECCIGEYIIRPIQ